MRYAATSTSGVLLSTDLERVQFRGKGLATALLDYMEAHARKHKLLIRLTATDGQVCLSLALQNNLIYRAGANVRTPRLPACCGYAISRRQASLYDIYTGTSCVTNSHKMFGTKS